jgi:hypothetical protein
MECPDCGGPCYDNRQNKRNPNSPDFRCKDRDCGFAKWLTRKGDPSRKKAFKKGQGGIAAPETNVLRRQSAQAKALDYLRTKIAARGTVNGSLARYEFTKEQFKLLIDWFEHDAVNGSIALRAKPKPEPEPEPEPEPDPEDDMAGLEATEPPDGEEDPLDL